MDPIEIIANEHGLIRRYLENLQAAGERMVTVEKLPREFFDKAVEFARTFVDKYHHFKEEHQLFVRLAEKKKGKIDPQVDSLRYQHERGRSMVASIAKSVDGYLKGDSIKTGDLLENLGAYVNLLRHHIFAEDHHFLPLARRELSKKELVSVLEVFDEERAKAGDRFFEESHKIVTDMGTLLRHS